MRDLRWGKWVGRMIGDLIADGDSLSVALIETGYARAYDGSERTNWCSHAGAAGRLPEGESDDDLAALRIPTHLTAESDFI